MRAKSVLLVLLCLTASCRRPREESTIIDLRRAPIGYEICAEHPPKLQRGNTELHIRLPAVVEPPSDAGAGGRRITFQPGPHDVDVYKIRDQDRLLWATGEVTLTDNKPRLRVKLPLASLSKGQYILGISGDPYFAFCTFNLE